jgi:hypothetical protein
MIKEAVSKGQPLFIVQIYGGVLKIDNLLNDPSNIFLMLSN